MKPLWNLREQILEKWLLLLKNHFQRLRWTWCIQIFIHILLQFLDAWFKLLLLLLQNVCIIVLTAIKLSTGLQSVLNLKRHDSILSRTQSQCRSNFILSCNVSIFWDINFWSKSFRLKSNSFVYYEYSKISTWKSKFRAKVPNARISRFTGVSTSSGSPLWVFSHFFQFFFNFLFLFWLCSSILLSLKQILSGNSLLCWDFVKMSIAKALFEVNSRIEAVTKSLNLKTRVRIHFLLPLIVLQNSHVWWQWVKLNPLNWLKNVTMQVNEFLEKITLKNLLKKPNKFDEPINLFYWMLMIWFSYLLILNGISLELCNPTKLKCY